MCALDRNHICANEIHDIQADPKQYCGSDRIIRALQFVEIVPAVRATMADHNCGVPQFSHVRILSRIESVYREKTDACAEQSERDEQHD